MSKPKGAWIEALEYTIDQDMKAKAKFLEHCIDRPEDWPEGMTAAEVIFGDVQRFIDKWKKLNE